MTITDEMRKALEDAAQKQTAFWESLRTLELLLGVDVDGTEDLDNADCEYLLSAKVCD